METAILGIALLVLAGALAMAGLAGRAGRLPRNRWVGIRVPALQANDEAWQAGHRAAAGALLAAAGPPLLLALALFTMPPARVQDWLLIYIVVGVVTGGLIALAVRRADRAAQEFDER